MPTMEDVQKEMKLVAGIGELIKVLNLSRGRSLSVMTKMLIVMFMEAQYSKNASKGDSIHQFDELLDCMSTDYRKRLDTVVAALDKAHRLNK